MQPCAGCDSAEQARPIRLAGTQLDDQGELRLYFGDTCSEVDTVEVELSRDRPDAADTVLDTWAVTSEGGASLSELTLGVVPDDFRQTDALRADWTDADFARLQIALPDDDRGLVLDVPELTAQAPDHPGEWYVNNLREVSGGEASSGWYTEDGYHGLLDPDTGITPICAP